MDPEQLVAQVAELRTQNQQFHPGVAADATAASSTARPRPSLDRLATIPSGDSGRGSGTVTNPARGNPTLVDTKGLGKPPPLKNTDSEFVSWARRTDFRRERTSWSERCLDVGRGKRVGNGANAATVVLIPLDTLRMLADQLYTVLMTFSLTTRKQRIPRRDPLSWSAPSWESCKEQWNGWRT